MSKHDDGGEISGRPGRSGGGDSEWDSDRAGHASGGRGGAPGKRTATQEVGSSDPLSTMRARIDVARGQMRAARSVYLPELRATLAERNMQDARLAAMELRQSMATIARELDDARERASTLGSDGALDQIDELTAEHDLLIDEVEPVLALAPPPAMPMSPLAPFSTHLDAATPPGSEDAEGQRALDQWNAALDQHEASPVADGAGAGANVIDASHRFARGDAETQRIAADGVASGGSSLPHQDAIQRSFGSHDVSGISTHVGGEAAVAASAIGAEAYATGNHVAFATQPSLFVAAHEAAHVVQQRAGVSLLGGVGQAGDVHEQQADAVAERVVRGESADALLGDGSHGVGTGAAVQRMAFGASGDAIASTGESNEIPALELDKTELSFPGVETGAQENQWVQVWNRGAVVATVTRCSVQGEQFVAGLAGPPGMPVDIDPGRSTWIYVGFRPAATGNHNALVAVLTPEATGVSLRASGVAHPSADPAHAAKKSRGRTSPSQATEPKPAEPGAAGDQDAGERVSRPRRSSLEPERPAVDFGAGVSGPVATAVRIWNVGDDTVIIDECSIVGGRAFAIRLISDATIASGAAAEVAIDLDPSRYDVAEATALIGTSDGATLRIPVTGRPASSAELSSIEGDGTDAAQPPDRGTEPSIDDDRERAPRGDTHPDSPSVAPASDGALHSIVSTIVATPEAPVLRVGDREPQRLTSSASTILMVEQVGDRVGIKRKKDAADNEWSATLEGLAPGMDHLRVHQAGTPLGDEPVVPVVVRPPGIGVPTARRIHQPGGVRGRGRFGSVSGGHDRA